jgi:DNA polymerase delta subunit 1
MVDKDISGMSWVRIAGGKFNTRKQKISHCQIEIECDHTAVEALSGPAWDKIAPLRIFSFDIECNPKHGFPTEQNDEIITIACVCKTSTEKSEKRIVLSLKECAPIAEVYVESFKKESEMLQKFEQLMISYDPDFITGYNIINFDLKYILGRAQVLGLRNYGYFGRTITTLSRITTGKYLSKAMGMRDTK